MEAFQSRFEYLTELKDQVNTIIGISSWHQVSQEDIDTFARITHDEQWIHTDPERAEKQSPYGTTIAHGFYVLSLASKFAYECYEISDVKMGINYGLDRVRFPNATPVGADIRGVLTLQEYQEITGGAQLKIEINFELQGQKKPACVATFIGRCYV